MAWPQLTCRSWDDFLKIVETIPKNNYPKTVGYVFRGQADAEWHLDTSLTRELVKIHAAVTPPEAEEIEKNLLHVFANSFQQYFPLIDSRDNPPLRWSVMQHYSAPTRLLDWTASLLVAAYFASESLWDRDGAMWIVDAKYLNEGAKCAFSGDQIGYEMLCSPRAQPVFQLYFDDCRYHQRIVVQQGLFTFCHQVFGDHEKLIEQVCQPESDRLKNECTVFCKVIIPRDLKSVFVRELSHKGFSAESLFPGSDGYGRSLRELARVMVHHQMCQHTSGPND